MACKTQRCNRPAEAAPIAEGYCIEHFHKNIVNAKPTKPAAKAADEPVREKAAEHSEE